MDACTTDRLRRQRRTRELSRHGIDRHLRATAFAGGVRPVGGELGATACVRQWARRERGGPGGCDGAASVRRTRRRLVLVWCRERRRPRRTHRNVCIATYFAGSRTALRASAWEQRTAGRTAARDAQRWGGGRE